MECSRLGSCRPDDSFFFDFARDGIKNSTGFRRSHPIGCQSPLDTHLLGNCDVLSNSLEYGGEEEEEEEEEEGEPGEGVAMTTH